MMIKTKDKVKILSGKDKGKEGAVLKVLAQTNKVIVEGVNVVKKHVKPGTLSKEGGVISVEKAIDVSNVLPVCDKCNRPVRVSIKRENGKKVRVCAKCGEGLDK